MSRLRLYQNRHQNQGSPEENELTNVATQTTAVPIAPTSSGIVLPAFTLWWRELVRFYRQRSRVVGVIASPLVFWLVIGSGSEPRFVPATLAVSSITSTISIPARSS